MCTGMAPITICLNQEQQERLENWIGEDNTEHRYARRAFIILLSAAGEKRLAIATSLKLNPSVVTKWKKRFAAYGVNGLLDNPRSGRPRKYNDETEKRVLSVLNKKPPPGVYCWNRPLIAAELGDVTAHQVWRVMKKNRISMEHRRA
jgi:transposase